jgi:xanthine dehydrogenase YagR molybdenum-binding subunit
MSIVDRAKQAAQTFDQTVQKKVVELAPDSWLPGGRPDPLIHHLQGPTRHAQNP